MILAIESGGIWFDGSVSYWVILKDFDREEIQKSWLNRMRNRKNTGENYITLEEELQRLGLIRKAIEGEDIEVISDY